MHVAVAALRAELSSRIDRAPAGQEIVVTDRGTPVARLLAIHLASLVALGSPDVVIAVWDRRLRAGAESAGVRLAPAA